MNCCCSVERAAEGALRVYSNVHRGSGPFAEASSALVDRAREIVLGHFGLSGTTHTVIFCTPRRAALLTPWLGGPVRTVTAADAGAPFGVTALAVRRRRLPAGLPPDTGGGMVGLVSPDSLVLAGIPDRYEAGTPPVIGIAALARALLDRERGGTPPPAGSSGEKRITKTDDILRPDEFGGLKGIDLLRVLRATVPQREVPTRLGPVAFTNLDNAASTPAFRPVWESAQRTRNLNNTGRSALADRVRDICGEFLGFSRDEYEVIFCANTTEAINIAARNLAFDYGDVKVVLNTRSEHHSNELPWRFLQGVLLERLETADDGTLRPADLERVLDEHNRKSLHSDSRIRLVALSGASNVLGTMNNLPLLTRISHEFGARVLVDAAQLVAHGPIAIERDGIDLLAFSGHKMYAPFGTGVLVIRRSLLKIPGPELDLIRSSGEANAAGIAAVGKAMMLLGQVGMEVIRREETILMNRLNSGLAEIPGVTVYGTAAPESMELPERGPILSIRIEGVPHNLAGRELAELGGIGVRTGCFCAHLLVKHLMGITPERAKGAETWLRMFPKVISASLPGLVRVSLGLENDESDVDRFLSILREIASRPRSPLNRLLSSTHNGTPFLPVTAVRRRVNDWRDIVLREVYG